MGVITQVLGNPDLLKHITSFQSGYAVKDWVYGDMAIAQNLTSLLDMIQDRLLFSERSIHLCARKGNLKLLKWLVDKNDPLIQITSDTYNTAAQHNHLDIIIWLHENSNVECPIIAIKNAMICCHLDVSKWFYENIPLRLDQRTIDSLTSNDYRYQNTNHFKLLNWIYSGTNYTFSYTAISNACENSITVLKWLMDRIDIMKEYRIQKEKLHDSRIINNVELMMYNCYYNAIHSKSIDILQYLVDQGIPYDKASIHKIIDEEKYPNIPSHHMNEFVCNYGSIFDEMKKIVV